jgi:hypothetical protein
MENKEAMKFPVKFLESISVGVDLEPVKWKFCSFICSENLSIVENLDIDSDLKKQVLKAIEDVKSVHEEALKTGSWDDSAADSAADSAYSAADSAAGSAADSAYSAAYSAARSAAHKKYADHLLKILRESQPDTNEGRGVGG